MLPAILGVGGLLSGLFSSISSRRNSKRNTDRTIQANKELAEYQYAKDKEMWERQNRYNTPTAQMARLGEAGLNPHLVYGTGSVVGNTSGQMPKYNAPRVDYNYEPIQADAMPALGIYNQTKLMQAQIDNLTATTKNTNARTATEIVRESNYLTDGQKKEIELNVASQLQETQVDTGKTALQIMRQKYTNMRKDAVTKDLKNEFQRHRNKWEKLGITPKDKLWIRAAAKLMQSMDIDNTWLFEAAKQVFGKDWMQIFKN